VPCLSRWNLIDSGIREDRINRMNRIEGQAKEYDLCGQVIGAATGIDEGLLLNFGAERLEYKKKFRLPKQGQVSF